MDLNQLKMENGESTVVSQAVCSGKNSLAFEEFLCKLKDDTEKYFECKCVAEHYDSEEISFEMTTDLNDFNEESADDNFDCGYGQWHINYLHINKNTAFFSYKNLDLLGA